MKIGYNGYDLETPHVELTPDDVSQALLAWVALAGYKFAGGAVIVVNGQLPQSAHVTAVAGGHIIKDGRMVE